MLTTYKARLQGSHIHWTDEQPNSILPNQNFDVLITVLSANDLTSVSAQDRGKRMAACFEKIAQTGGVKGISDPVAWQQEIRQDRQFMKEETDYAD